MTDRELLELAAKAAGIDGAPWPDDEEAREGLWLKGQRTPDNNTMWNPLDNDGDALRLAVKLQLTICNEHVSAGVTYCTHGDDECTTVRSGDTEEDVITVDYAATRRAIVLAAAEIGKQLGERP